MRCVGTTLLLATAFGIPSVSTAKTWVVPTPAAPTIQAGINHSSAGDTVVVKCGHYAVNHLVMKSGILLTSEFGNPGCVTLDGKGLDVILSCSYVDAPTTIRGFTLEDGSPRATYCSNSSLSFVDCVFDENAAGPADGGAAYAYYSSLTFLRCEFTNNSSGYNGGALYAFESDLTLDACTLWGNFAGLDGGALRCVHSDLQISNSVLYLNWAEDGGAVYCRDCSLAMDGCLFHSNAATGGGGALFCYRTPSWVTGCTFARNSGPQAGSIYIWNTSGVVIENSILAFSPLGPSITCLNVTSPPALSCCDIYGNPYGDWVGCVEGQPGVDGNISEDPLFCAPSDYNYEIAYGSPCSPENSPPGCGLIGALEATCVIASIAQDATVTAESLSLSGNTPNPFHLATGIEYTIPAAGTSSRVVLAVYDVSGREVNALVDEEQKTGRYRVTWDGTDRDGIAVASGVYFCRITWNGCSQTRRVVLLR